MRSDIERKKETKKDLLIYYQSSDKKTCYTDT